MNNDCEQRIEERRTTPNYLSGCNSLTGTPIRGRSPARCDSPMMKGYDSPPLSPSVRRAREMTRDLRRGKNFRESSLTRRSSGRSESEDSRHSQHPQLPPGTELSFIIRPSVGGRKGWKIMPEDENGGETDPKVLKRIVNMIKDMEITGSAIPEKISIKI